MSFFLSSTWVLLNRLFYIRSPSQPTSWKMPEFKAERFDTGDITECTLVGHAVVKHCARDTTTERPNYWFSGEQIISRKTHPTANRIRVKPKKSMEGGRSMGVGYRKIRSGTPVRGVTIATNRVFIDLRG